ncbi:MAG: chemotaxis protein CheA [Phycisphaerales bacterium]|nr:chemotaxis protein CheA [Phycisphaerales bacterium]
MSRTLPQGNNPNLQEWVESLTATITRIDKDDLSGLAQMHGWCELITEYLLNAAPPCSPDAVDRSKSLTHRLETLILGETLDADAIFQEIVQSVTELADHLAQTSGSGLDNSTPPPNSANQTASAVEQSDIGEAPLSTAVESTEPSSLPDDPGEIAARMDSIFSDQPAAAAADSAQTSDTILPVNDNKSDAPDYESTPLLIDPKELEFVKAFAEEAAEHIEAIEAGLMEVERSPDDTVKIDDLFRPFHTIKGMAGFLNLRDINCLTHEVETVLDQGRKGKRKVTPGLIDLIFDVVDILKLQVSAVAVYVANPTGEVVSQPPITDMIQLLRKVVAGIIEPPDRHAHEGSAAQRVGENLVAQGAVPQEAVDYALEIQQTEKPDKKLGEILVEAKTATAKQVSQAIRPQSQQAAQDTSIRIDTDKLDALVDMVGELVIAQTLVTSNARISDDPKLTKDVGQVTKIVRDVQELAMSMRMVPIGPTFNKMNRLVRDVSRKAGKQVELIITGEDTELDKNVIQQISDPLVHMVRNAVDHGIESPAERLAAGKNEVGRVHLSAYHHGGNIVIEISDDGKGLDPKKLIAKGVEKGLLQPGEEIPDKQAFALIFAAGFSTAEQVTDISGRGVGMDVVRRNIEQLRGRVEINSEKGKGSTFSIRLPLTLAIIDGMIVGVGSDKFIIPTIAIEQSLKPRPEQITRVQQRGEILNVRGQLIPLIQLGQLFGMTGYIHPCDTMVVIVHCEGRMVGLVVEDLLGQQQVVIKSLGERFEGLQGICGAAILGDGRVGLILEMAGLRKLNETVTAAIIDYNESEPPEAANDCLANNYDPQGESVNTDPLLAMA